MTRLSRRSLIRGATGLAAGYWATRFFQEHGYYPVSAAAPEPPAVVVAEGSDEDSPTRFLKAALLPLGGIEAFVKPGQSVCIKPNATWANKPHTASSTDPELLRALIEMVRAAGASRIVVIDRCTIDPAPMCLAESGIGQVIDETGVESGITNLYQEPLSKYTEVEAPEGRAFKSISVVKAATETDVRINMAVAKTHLVLPVTLCCKHMMGFTYNPSGLHASFEYLDQGIADLLATPKIHPDLHILEAIRVRVRGPSYGDGTDVTDPSRVKRFNRLLVGTDPVLMDSYACENFFMRSAHEITHIVRAWESGHGEIDVKKALESGRLRSYPVEELLRPTPTPTFTPAPTDWPTPTPPLYTPTPEVTPTPFRPSTSSTSGESILDISPMLNGALVPLAMIVGGVSVVMGRRLAGGLPRASGKPAGGEHDDNKPEEPGAEGAHDR
ncbi:MAG TPA: DUF362 domain-containing protein [Anaerolineae bacterium]|nr:DUF362 domain-containing protein [Anaerolineae bacterium]HOR00142.1 DUF362 domain-containing protein [Anaerolineae bacterium]